MISGIVIVSFQDGTDVPEGTRIVDENNQDITQVKVSNTGDGYKGTFKVLYPTLIFFLTPVKINRIMTLNRRIFAIRVE